MRWHKAIAIGRPLRNVQLLERPPDGTQPGSGSVAGEKAAYERGLRDGEKRLSEQLLSQRKEMLDLKDGVLTSLRNAVPQVVRETQSTLVQLALEVAQKLVCGLPISVEMVEAAVRTALAQVEEAAEFHIYLHPDDLELLREGPSPVLTPTGKQVMHFHKSNEVGRGGCLVQTRFGVVDARRETKLALLQESLNS